MKRIGLILVSFLVLMSCSKSVLNYKPDSKEYDIYQIYSLVIQRSAGYNNMKVIPSDSLATKPITSDNIGWVKRGIKNFNEQVQIAINDFDDSSDLDKFQTVLQSFGVQKGKRTQYQVSKIGFNPSRDFAVMYESDTNKPDISHQSYLFLKKVQGIWKFDSEVIL